MPAWHDGDRRQAHGVNRTRADGLEAAAKETGFPFAAPVEIRFRVCGIDDLAISNFRIHPGIARFGNRGSARKSSIHQSLNRPMDHQFEIAKSSDVVVSVRRRRSWQSSCPCHRRRR
jgi:hypothetical protein